MVVLFAVLAAASYGVSDFLGGLAARGSRALSVLAYNYPVGALIMVALLPVFPGHVSVSTLIWSVAGGVAGLFGVGLLYGALAIAPMNVISPITAVLAALVPVVFGVVAGERPGPLAWLGIALGLISVTMVSRTPGDQPHGPLASRAVLMALASGIGFGCYFVCLARTDADSGLWPVIIARICSSLLVLPLARRTGALVRLRGRLLALTLAAGVLDAAANLAFLLASRHGYLSVAGVITSLYPAGTVLLAVWLLKERTGRLQRVGLAMAATAVVLVAR